MFERKTEREREREREREKKIDKVQVVTGHTPTLALFGLAPFPLFCPAALVYSPVLAVHPFFLAFCRGAFLGPVRFCGSRGPFLEGRGRASAPSGPFFTRTFFVPAPGFLLFFSALGAS